MSRMIHVEQCAQKPARVGAFYREVFGWQSEKWEHPTVCWLFRSARG